MKNLLLDALLIVLLATYVTAQTNYALSFDGNNDYVSIANESSFDFTTAMTVEAWIKITSFNNSYTAIVTKGDDSWRLQRNSSSNQLAYGTNFGPTTWNDLNGSTNVNDGNWHHVAAVYSNPNKYLYIDGTLDVWVSSSGGSLQNSSYQVYIGANAQASGRNFYGLIDEVRIWNVARSQTEIQNNMYSEISPNANLIGYYKMNEGSGTTLTDNSGNSNTGTISGASWAISDSPLPVELISFSGVINGNSVELNWQTSTEVNNYGFEIQRKKETHEWEKTGFVIGHGNSNSAKNYSFFDKNPKNGKILYRLKQIDFDGSYEYSNVVEVEIRTPSKLVLHPNYPNPFNPSTKIKYEIPTEGKVKLAVYDILGGEVTILVNEHKNAGSYEIEFNASSFSGGVYFYTLYSNNYLQTKRMILIK